MAEITSVMTVEKVSAVNSVFHMHNNPLCHNYVSIY